MREDIKLNDRAAAVSDQMVERFEKIIEPEIGLDIYNLGFIYEINLTKEGHCNVIITFSEVGCACIGEVPVAIKKSLVEIEEINDVSVDVVWSPVWQMSRISRLGRITLGISPRGVH